MGAQCLGQRGDDGVVGGKLAGDDIGRLVGFALHQCVACLHGILCRFTSLADAEFIDVA
jgi:hypothetical protein